MFLGFENEISTIFFIQVISVDFEQFCRLDVFGFVDFLINDQDVVYFKFKEQLIRYLDGYYEIGFFWKGSYLFLLINKFGSFKRLYQFLRRFEYIFIYDQYDVIIQE